MGRAAWLLVAWLPLVACDGSEALSMPSEVAAESDDDGSVEPTDEPSDGKPKDDPSLGLTPTRPSTFNPFDTTSAEPDPLADALEQCANGVLEPLVFERAFEARLCEEWVSCADSDCLVGPENAAERIDEESFDAMSGCDCLEAAWSCETSYGASNEMRVVVPDLACFEVY